MENKTTQAFAVRVADFEGPLPRLLELVEKRQLPVSQVSLAQVTDDFINYVRELPKPTFNELAEFIAIAATLMLIKSRSLLPGLPLADDETREIGNLEQRLKLYQVIRNRALALGAAWGKNPLFFPGARPAAVIFSPSAELTLANLRKTFHELIQSWPPPAGSLPEIKVRKIVSLEEMIKNLTARVQAALKINFSDFVKNQKERMNIIVGFLALLELCKQGAVEVDQGEPFQEIRIATK